MKKTIKKIAFGSWMAYSLYWTIIAAPEHIVSWMSPKITSQAQLEQLMEKERRKIYPDDKYKIKARLSDKSEAFYRYKGENYEIVIGGYLATEGALRHELYHVLDGHGDNDPDSNVLCKIQYFLWDEPQASIYTVTVLKP